MCQIQFIGGLGGKKVDEVDMQQFNRMMCFGSMFNRDAFGVFNRKYDFKKGGTYDESAFNDSKLKGERFVIGHNRLSTSYGEGSKKEDTFEKPTFMTKLFFPEGIWGDILPIYTSGMIGTPINLKNNSKNNSKDKLDNNIKSNYLKKGRNMNHHPFTLNDFVLVHNGVIYNSDSLRNIHNIESDILTDSYTVLALIDKFFKKQKGKRRERVVKAIEKTMECLMGSYSIFLYDKKEDDLFYFKNPSTKFCFYLLNDSILCGSTSFKNIALVYHRLKKRKKIPIEDNEVYLITNSKYNPIKKVSSKEYQGNEANLSKKIKEIFNRQRRMVKAGIKRKFGFVPDYMIEDNLFVSFENKKKIKQALKKAKIKFHREDKRLLAKIVDFKSA